MSHLFDGGTSSDLSRAFPAGRPADDHARAVDRPIAGHPLDIVYPESCKSQLADRPRPTKLFFAPSFFDNVAELITPPIMYWGTPISRNAGEEPAITYATPIGDNPLLSDAYWLWPAGHCIKVSTQTLITASPALLRALKKNRHNHLSITYRVAATRAGYHYLGYGRKAEVDAYLQEPGVVADRLQQVVREVLRFVIRRRVDRGREVA